MLLIRIVIHYSFVLFFFFLLLIIQLSLIIDFEDFSAHHVGVLNLNATASSLKVLNMVPSQWPNKNNFQYGFPCNGPILHPVQMFKTMHHKSSFKRGRYLKETEWADKPSESMRKFPPRKIKVFSSSHAKPNKKNYNQAWSL